MTSKLLFIVTGASGGFGSAILRQIDALYGDTAVIIACARNKDKLYENTKSFSAAIKHISVDFGSGDRLKERCEAICDLCEGQTFEKVYLYNNHGLIGDSTKLADDYDDAQEITDYFVLNLTSFQVLTTVFLKKFPGVAHTCVNISSLCAIKVFPSMSQYCTGKAARLMFYKCLAEERPEVRVLNYSPGPMFTAMTENLHVEMADERTRKVFKQLSDGEIKWVDTDESAKKMLVIVKDDVFTSGEQIDFYER